MHRRARFRQNLNSLYLPFYDELCEMLPPYWAPYQGFRTFQEQDDLYSQGRTKPGKVVTRAKGGESPHNYGCATDWIIWDNHEKPVWLDADDPAWDEYVSAVEKIGLKCGDSWGDINHNEIRLKCKWKEVLSVLMALGTEGVQNHIKRMMYE